MSVVAAFSIAFRATALRVEGCKSLQAHIHAVTIEEITDDSTEPLVVLDEADGEKQRLQRRVVTLEEQEETLQAQVQELSGALRTEKQRRVKDMMAFEQERQRMAEELHTWQRRQDEWRAHETQMAAMVKAQEETTRLRELVETMQTEMTTLREQKETLTQRLASRPSAAVETERRADALNTLLRTMQTQLIENTTAFHALVNDKSDTKPMAPTKERRIDERLAMLVRQP
ncbi:hypothetical protein Poli38472_012855 [Pythium oligandrum]|uniref:Uncharacterized protein n=1 Tax=Pythium oligandrum TaxID=41045 RepID=A0A8K1CJT1_PYTOL|nr:hypothetical protein Poli38472_012855 [Pythium oligandrum]|eukprot:TMW64233.1 hypothetical protein Poli38472_012855 [Pythium oligandrum]